MVVRLDFQPAEFVRIAWASEEAREIWEHRIRAVSNAWCDIEKQAVVEGIKDATLQTCDPDLLVDLINWASSNGLSAVPLKQEAAIKVYASASQPPVKGEPWIYRVVIGKHEKIQDFLFYWNASHDAGMGQLLGFPACCQDFFIKYWTNEKWRDLTYPMVKVDPEQDHFSLDCPITTNVLLRWIGVRLISHLPCSFNCTRSNQIGEQMLELAKRHKPTESAWLQEILNWPVRWSSLHGVAIITTPVFKIVTASDPLSKTVTVDRPGNVYPIAGATGTVFPFRTFRPLSFIRADTWSDNGFSSLPIMEESHQVILDLIRAANYPSDATIVDMGCGNGLLLEKVRLILPECKCTGIEKDTFRAERAIKRFVGTTTQILVGDLTDELMWNPPYTCILISANRIFEQPQSDQESILKNLARMSTDTILYTYDDKELNSLNWGNYFEIVDGMDNNRGVKAYLLRSLYAKETGATSSSSEKN